MSEPKTATPEQIDQQRRMITATRSHVSNLLATVGALQDDQTSYNWLGLADDAILADEAFEGSGTTRADYRAAMVSVAALADLLATGHGTNFARFAL